MSAGTKFDRQIAAGRHPKFSMKECMIIFLTEQQRYSEALALLDTLSIRPGDQRPLDPRLVVTKAFCLFQEQKYAQVLELLISIERQGWATTDCFLLKAKALYRLAEFETAKRAFEAAEAYRPGAQTRRWIRRCAAKIDPLRRLVRYEAVPPPADAPREWRQTDAQLALSIPIGDVPPEQLAVEFAPATVHITGPAVDLWIDLPGQIVPAQSAFSAAGGRVELTMAKAPGAVGQWPEVEATALNENKE